jgi:cysteine desulfurase/selenocysteine lyase
MRMGWSCAWRRVTDAGELDMAGTEALLADGKVGLVAITHMSNVLGTVHAGGAAGRSWRMRMGQRSCSTGRRPIVHRRIDVRALDADFYVFTGHKLYGPTGIGVLYGKAALLEMMPPSDGWRGHDLVGDL